MPLSLPKLWDRRKEVGACRLPGLVIREVISYASYSDLTSWARVNSFCYRIAIRRIWNHLRLHDGVVHAKGSAWRTLLMGEGRVVRKIKAPLRGLRDESNREYPLTMPGECIKYFTLSMGCDTSAFAVQRIAAEVIPALPRMWALARFEWDCSTPPPKELMEELAKSCPHLSSLHCCPRRAGFPVVTRPSYRDFEGLELMKNLKCISIRVRDLGSVARLAIAIRSSPALERLDISGPFTTEYFLLRLPGGRLGPLKSLTLDNISIFSSNERHLIRALEPSTQTLTELSLGASALFSSGFLRNFLFPNLTCFRHKYMQVHYTTAQEYNICVSILLFLRSHTQLEKIKIDCIPSRAYTPYPTLPSPLEQTLMAEGRSHLTELALNSFSVPLASIIRLITFHGKTLRNLSFFSSELSIENSYLRTGQPQNTENFSALSAALAEHARGLESIQVHHTKNPLIVPLPNAAYYRLTPGMFRRVYRSASRKRMRALAESMPALRYAADWGLLAWFVVRSGGGRVRELVPVGDVAWSLEMSEAEERSLAETFSWNGRFSSRLPFRHWDCSMGRNEFSPPPGWTKS